MKFSLMYDLRTPPEFGDQPIDHLYAEFLDQCAKVDAQGFDAIWITEHHYSASDNWIPAAVPMCAAVAARTQNVKVGTGVIALPLHNPVRVAEQFTVLDAISGGRSRLGVALGYRVEEYATDRMDRKERIPRLIEGIDLIKRCWTENDAFSFEGKYYAVQNMTFYPKPVQKPYPPIYIAAQAEASVRRAAQLGCHVFPNSSRILCNAYVDELVAQGRNPHDYEIVAFPDHLFITPDPERDWQRWEKEVMFRWTWYDKSYSEGTSIPLITLAERRKRVRNAFVTPSGAIDFVQSLIDRVPCTEICLFAGYPGMPLSESYKSLDLLGKHVIPHFRSLPSSALVATVAVRESL
jgi:alkanesulfonate monooxygenase SsuD/methylene tetrahydromethanopterin reductase-like flavin-dependent oxidoreductase (luciferase family)